MERRDFLRLGALAGMGAVVGPSLLSACVPAEGSFGGREYFPSLMPQGSILDLPASEAPIDTVVVVMMENRSFDHMLGFLGSDEGYLDRGLRNYGTGFSIDAAPNQTYLDAAGIEQATWSMSGGTNDPSYRGCGFEDPAHGWDAARVQRDRGFLAEGADNDRFALAYLEEDNVPFYARMARRFTTFDQYHCSILGATQPNRRYLHSAQSGGYKNNYIPIKELGHQWDTIWDRFRAAGVPCRSYSPDLPSLAFWGARMAPMLGQIGEYFEACQAGKLPNVVYLDPPYLPWWQADDHPLCDPMAGQRYLRDVFRAFVESPHWERGAFIITYDENGGFFDHVRPPVLPDLLASEVDADNFGQTGFRVPTFVASPYSRPGFVDHRQYDHTSILRFLEWRFLGAPAEGPAGEGWWLTPRDRFANNIGASLGLTQPDPEVFDMDAVPLRQPTDLCNGSPQLLAPGMQTEHYAPAPKVTSTTIPSTPPPHSGGPGNDMLQALNADYFDRIGVPTDPSPMAAKWVNDD